VGTYNALPDPLAELRGPLCCGEGRGRKKKQRRREEGKGYPPNKNRGYSPDHPRVLDERITKQSAMDYSLRTRLLAPSIEQIF